LPKQPLFLHIQLITSELNILQKNGHLSRQMSHIEENTCLFLKLVFQKSANPHDLSIRPQIEIDTGCDDRLERLNSPATNYRNL
jgi:hypothetical protein